MRNNPYKVTHLAGALALGLLQLGDANATEFQARHLGKVHGVAGEECGVVDESNAGDPQIHGADADSFR